jgi:hypothetical protein
MMIEIPYALGTQACGGSSPTVQEGSRLACLGARS